MKKLLSFMLAFVMALAMAGCGSSDTEEPEEESQKEETQDTTEKVKIIDVNLTEEEYVFGISKGKEELLDQVNEFIGRILENGTMDEIIESYFSDGEPEPVTSAEADEDRDQLVVVTCAANEPFEYKLGDDFYGIDMEIAHLLAEELDKELVIRNLEESDDLAAYVAEGNADIAMAALTMTEEREKLVNFSTVYYDASLCLIVPGDETAFDECKTERDVRQTLNEMNGAIVGVQSGTTAQSYVEGIGSDEDQDDEDEDDEDSEDSEEEESENPEGLPVECETYKNSTRAVEDMIEGNIQCVVMDKDPALIIVAEINK